MPIFLHSSRDKSDEFVQMYSGRLPAPATGLASAGRSGPGQGLGWSTFAQRTVDVFCLFTVP